MDRLYDDIIIVNNNYLVDKNIENPIFVCTISYTETAEIPGITSAGANPDLIKFTPPADAEFLYYGKCVCIDTLPATPDGKPTPALITKTALNLANIPFMIVDAGVKIRPFIPVLSFDLRHGYNIMDKIAMDIADVKKAYAFGNIVGEQLAKNNDMIILGESIPGGTTTALGIMLSLGIEASDKISSSMPDNPHGLKNKVLKQTMERNKIKFGGLKDKPFEAISIFGDPMIPSITGIAQGAVKHGCNVMLAGGTQMCAVLSILKTLKVDTDKISLGTTKYILDDPLSDFENLTYSIDDKVGIFASDLHLAKSEKSGLEAFSRGYVKEGVGAGGVSIAAMLKTHGKINGTVLLKHIESEYEKRIEIPN